jgi:hypothetical protein
LQSRHRSTQRQDLGSCSARMTAADHQPRHRKDDRGTPYRASAERWGGGRSTKSRHQSTGLPIRSSTSPRRRSRSTWCSSNGPDCTDGSGELSIRPIAARSPTRS